MPAFFKHRRGSVFRVASRDAPGGPKQFQIIVEDMDIKNPDTRAIITQCGIMERGNYQFLHTLNETIYAYVFGDRIGELRVSGICFVYPCGETETSGVQQIIDNYRKYRIAGRKRAVRVSFGEVDYIGFLVGMNLDIVDPENNLGQWAFSFNTFPGNHQAQ